MTILAKAIEYAARGHGAQIDKNGKPYILHPLRVMFSILNAGHSEDIAAAGVLHDVVEDTDIQFTEIVSEFGIDISSMVDALSRRPEEVYNAYIERCLENPGAMVVKTYDLLDNLDLARLTSSVGYERYLETLKKIYRKMQVVDTKV